MSLTRISLNEQVDRLFGKLCKPDENWMLKPYDAMPDIRLANTTLGPSQAPAALHVGDFNNDGLLDLLIIDADTGVVQLLEATRIEDETQGFWEDLRAPAVASKGYFRRSVKAQHHKVVTFELVSEDRALSSPEDPAAAAFFDVDENGRQDILVVQAHGTRLIWNSYNEVDDSEFFKATTFGAVYKCEPGGEDHAAKPTVRAYDRQHGQDLVRRLHGHEQHICTQCPQAGFLTLQTCTCLFGIRRIANNKLVRM